MTATKPIPMVDLHGQYMSMQSEIDSAIKDVLEKTQFIMGSNVHEFEKEVEGYLGVKHAIACANGTDALHLALLALGIGPGDEVITTPFTFIATAEAIAYVGATPVFVDIDENTFNIDANLIEGAVTEKTRAIIPVHIFGLPCDMDAISGIAKKHNLSIVEDCAQSFGAKHGTHTTGGIGDLGSHSFFPSKNLGCYGDGGMVTTNNKELADKLRVFRAHGSTKQYHHTVIGYNSRLDELQAAILRQKLKHIDTFNAGRLRVASRYCENLADLSIQLPLLRTPTSQTESLPVFHQFTFLSEQRDLIKQALTDNGISSAIYYPIPLHQQEAMQALQSKPVSMPISERTATNCLSLPIYPEMPDDAIDRVCETIRSALQ